VVDRDLLTGLLGGVPEDWLLGTPAQAYVDYLAARMAAPREWVMAAEEARRSG
jgi:hypothetical protein